MKLSAHMGLSIWNMLLDPYNHEQLANNWAKVDLHDHSPGRGVLIPTEGLANESVTNEKIAKETITSEKIGVPIASYREGLASERPAATAALKGLTWYAKDTHVYSECTGLVWNTLALPLPIIESAVSVEAKSGETIKVIVNSKTITLPTPSVNSYVGVLLGEVELTTITSATHGGNIFGDFIRGTTTAITLASNQHVLLQADGSDWHIIAGEPRRTQNYHNSSNVEVGVPHLVNRERPVLVNLWWTYRVTGSPSWECQVKANGNIVSRTLLSEESSHYPAKLWLSCTFLLMAGESWEITESGNSYVEEVGESFVVL